MFDKDKFLTADEQTQRIMIAEAITPKPWKHSKGDAYTCVKCGQDFDTPPTPITMFCSVVDPLDTDFRILAFELRDKVDCHQYDCWLKDLCHKAGHYTEYTTPTEMICSALMVWPKEDENLMAKSKSPCEHCQDCRSYCTEICEKFKKFKGGITKREPYVLITELREQANRLRRRYSSQSSYHTAILDLIKAAAKIAKERRNV
jgi:hypothetical protein